MNLPTALQPTRFCVRAAIAPIFACLCALLLCNCATTHGIVPVPSEVASSNLIRSEVIVSVADQCLALFEDGECVATHPISTSKFGVGSKNGSYRTPEGRMKIVEKIGENAPIGMVFKARQPTGEVLRPNAPGRDPIVTRILRLEGLDATNRNTFSRCIYIHGTPEERTIGRPASYGCIRMKSGDMVDLFDAVNAGTNLTIVRGTLARGIYEVVHNNRQSSGSAIYAQSIIPTVPVRTNRG